MAARGLAGGLAIGSMVVCIAAFGVALWDVAANSCAMTYMWPNYLAVPVPHAAWGTRPSYSLYLYREGRSDGGVDGVRGLPVLFIPGNAGSGKQVRSLGAQADTDLAEQAGQSGSAAGAGAGAAPELDFWAVDFDEELSALSGGDLAAQARFVCKSIPFVLSKYGAAPPGVIVVGHSMGGIVARLVASQFCRAYDVGGQDGGASRIVAVFTIATPHTGLPVVAGRCRVSRACVSALSPFRFLAPSLARLLAHSRSHSSLRSSCSHALPLLRSCARGRG
jgi:pimeloyl-ACP methyl ester carboxylesterase